MIEHVFMNCGIVAEPMELPDGSVGRQIIIIDNESHQVFRYPMTADHATGLGEKLTAPSIEVARGMPGNNGHGHLN